MAALRLPEASSPIKISTRQPGSAGQLGRGSQTVAPGQADVQQRHVRAVLQHGGHDLVTGRHRGGHLNVRLQAQQRDQRVPHYADVLRDQDADHRALRTAPASAPGVRRAGDAGICVPPIPPSLGRRAAVA